VISKRLNQSINFDYSTVITCFNAESTIEKSIKSASNQIISPTEIIVVDDGSKDNSFKIIQSLSTDIANLKIIRNTTNMGVSFSRNIAILQTISPIIMILDDDDVSTPNRIMFHRENFLNGADLSYVSSIKVYANEVEISYKNDNYLGTLNPNYLFKYLMSGEKYLNLNFFIPASTLAFRKELWSQIGKFDENLTRSEDVDFAIRSSMRNGIFGFVSGLGVVRINSTGLDKQINVDEHFHNVLLSKFESLLKVEEISSIRMWIKIRSLYFTRRYILLLCYLCLYLMKNRSSYKKIFVGIKRIYLDIRISN
jgi:glycosyltransferase involved in cell wall biosynthesis